MIRPLFAALFLVLCAACATPPPRSIDPASRWLEPNESIALRMPAQLLHGHDMTEQSYDASDGYQPIPTYEGELLLTDRRMLFIERSDTGEPSRLSIPYGAVKRARPSQTPLLNYVVVWDAEGHPDSFVVDARHVRALHRQVGQALTSHRTGPTLPGHHAVKDGR